MRNLAWIVALLLAVIIAPKAHANEVTFTLDQNTCSGGCTPSPFATVDVTTAGQPADTVLVTEKLTGATQYVKTGAGYALAFSVIGDPTLTIGSLTTNFSVGNAAAGLWGGHLFERGNLCGVLFGIERHAHPAGFAKPLFQLFRRCCIDPGHDGKSSAACRIFPLPGGCGV